MSGLKAGGAQVTETLEGRYEAVLNTETLTLIADLQRRFGPRRRQLLADRQERQSLFDRGELPDFADATKDVRQAEWKVAAPAPGLIDRRVEITGPTDAKMTINALNSGARVWLADFEDANCPRWQNMIEGQLNLADALDRTLGFTSPEGKEYQLGENLATIVVRPRGWHLPERHILVDGEEVSASLVDFSLYLVLCAARQLDRGLGPYYYLPKLESHLEARLWNDVFNHSEDALSLPRGTIRATVLIETIAAAFEMDEILFELREHSSGLNAGRWDYLFSIIKKFRNLGAEFVLPDRNSVTMAAPFMASYAELLVHTCHRRGAHAIGGMAAFIPSRRDPEVNAKAMEKVSEDKQREARMGFDGSWVAHPDLVGVCQESFDAVLGERPNQLERVPDVHTTAADLLAVTSAGRQYTEEGLRNDISVALQYIASWLGGTGAVAIFNLMEDAATAEIARSQVWQWLRNRIVLQGGELVTGELVLRVTDEELAKIRLAFGDAFDAERFDTAQRLFLELALSEQFSEFLTVPAYQYLS